MSDDHSKYENGTKSQKEIITALSSMTSDQIKEVQAQITVSEEWVNRYFAQFFQTAPQTTPERVNGEKESKTMKKRPQKPKNSHLEHLSFKMHGPCSEMVCFPVSVPH